MLSNKLLNFHQEQNWEVRTLLSGRGTAQIPWNINIVNCQQPNTKNFQLQPKRKVGKVPAETVLPKWKTSHLNWLYKLTIVSLLSINFSKTITETLKLFVVSVSIFIYNAAKRNTPFLFSLLCPSYLWLWNI